MKGLRSGRAWALALLATWGLLRLGTGFDGLFGQDPHAQLRYAAALRAWLEGGPAPGPFFWPPYFALAGAILSSVMPLAVAAQAAALLGWLLAWAAGLAALARLHGVPPRSALPYWTLAFALSPYVVRAALVVQAETLAAFFQLAAVALGAAWLRDGGPARLVGAGAALGLAAGTRHPAAVVLVPLAAWVAWQAWRRRALGPLALAVAAAVLVFAPTLLTRPGPELLPVQYPALQEWSLGNFFARTVVGSQGTRTYGVPTLVFALAPPAHPGFMTFGLALLPFVRRRDLARGPAAALALGWLLFALFVAGAPYQHERHLLASFPLLALLLWPAAERLRELVGRPAWLAAALGLALLLQGALAWRALQGPLRAQRLELQAVALLRAQPPVRLYTFVLTEGLRTRGVPQALHDLWAEEPAAARAGDLALFAPERLRPQWQGRDVMRRWDELTARFQAVPVAALPEGFTLSRLEARP